MKIAVLSLLAILAFAGCTSSAAVPGWYAGVPMEKLYIGMSAGEAREAAGYPTAVNRTTLDGVVLEQWVYRDMWGRDVYLYFDNNRLKAWQN